MSKVLDADDIRYTKRHEWALLEDDVVTIGLTDYGQKELGRVTFVDMPAEGVDVDAGDEAVTLESAGDSLSVMAPLAGTIVEVNGLLEDTPDLVNSDPYGDGWLFRLEATDIKSWSDLMTAEEYEEWIG